MGGGTRRHARRTRLSLAGTNAQAPADETLSGRLRRWQDTTLWLDVPAPEPA